MDELTGNEDGWVVARIAALERANRRLWVALGALAMTLVSVCIAAGLLATSLELPGPMTAPRDAEGGHSLVADDVTVRGALRVVDDVGRNLIFIGREDTGAGEAADSSQAVIGLFAGAGSEEPQQTIRLATSAAGSALSVNTPDGAHSVSMFAGESGVSVDLRKGDATRAITERSEGASSAPPTAGTAPAGEGERVETPTSTGRSSDTPRVGVVDLSDGALQPLGDGFFVGGLSLSDQSGVLRVRGRLVNTTSVDQLRAEFRLVVAGRELPFSVARIAAGGSTPFTVELPPAKSDALRSARLRWVRSTVSYLAE